MGALGLAVALLLGAAVGASAESGGWLAAGLIGLALAGAVAGALIGRSLIRGAESARQVRSGFWINQKIEPLVLEVSDQAPVRINIIHPSIDLKHFFGGFIAVFNLAARLAARGHRVRLLGLEASDLPADWRERIGAYEGIGGAIGEIEVEIASDRAVPISCNPDDRLVATHWTAAHVAAAALPDLQTERFLYLIQEYEPFIFPMSSAAALARASYDLPHTAMFSTGLLREWFVNNRIGVFADGVEAGDGRSVTFENAITPVGPVSATELDRPGPRRLVFYARPEQHASRNLFEIGAMALDEAVAAGHFQGWDLAAMGTVDIAGGTLELPRSGASMKVLPRSAQAEYGRLLGTSDLGMSLMYTPHPSLVPIEMAAAGMVTVTNTFENKDAPALAGISANLIAAPPSVEGVAGALIEAEGRVGDLEGRAEGSHVDWPSSWDDALGEDQLAAVERLI